MPFTAGDDGAGGGGPPGGADDAGDDGTPKRFKWLTFTIAAFR